MSQAVAKPAAPKAALVAGGQVAAIVPRNIEETFRLAEALAGSGMAPASLNSPAKVMVAIMAGAELGMAPFQSLQSFAVINGKPAIWGDGLMAVVRSQGFMVREWIEGEGDEMVARCEVTRPDNGDIAPGEFSVADAKKAGLWNKQGPWQQYPKRMLQMRARAFALRDGAADVLRGFQIREEVEDYPAGREEPQRTGLMARLPGSSQGDGFAAGNVSQIEHLPKGPEDIDAVLEGDAVPHFDPQTGEVFEPDAETAEFEDAAQAPEPGPAVDPEADAFPGDEPRSQSSTARTAPAPNKAGAEGGKLTLDQRVEAFYGRLNAATNKPKVDAIWAASAGLRDELGAIDSEHLTEMAAALEAKYAALEDAEAGR